MKIYNNPNIRFPVLEGDKVIKEVDNGGKMFILYHLQILRL